MFLSSVLLEAIKLGGIESKIVCEPTKNSKTSIELKNGYNFTINPFDLFYNQKGRWDREKVKCLIVDGFVENISEIDHLLTESNKTKNPMIIFANGFNDDVIQTLKFNFERETLDIFPVKIDIELDSINTINDIAVVCGGDIISSLKGNSFHKDFFNAEFAL